jgi:hypothetical protein
MDNPLIDVAHFLAKPGWLTPVFWLLLIASIGGALYVLVVIPGQRTFANIWNFGCRLSIGCMWWQSTLWKLPPDYTEPQHHATAFLYYPVRWFLNSLRGIDSFVFALLFVSAVGLGPDR